MVMENGDDSRGEKKRVCEYVKNVVRMRWRHLDLSRSLCNGIRLFDVQSLA